MAVTVTWSLTNGGAGVDNVDHSTIASGAASSGTVVYLEHDAVNLISNCKLYIAATAADDYTGDFAPEDDYDLLLALGDGETAASFGGLQLNFNATSSFPSGDWSDYDDKDKAAGTTVRTGTGDTKDNGIIIPTETGASSAGVIPAGTSPNVRFKMRVKNPSGNTADLGVRQVALKLRFTYTT